MSLTDTTLFPTGLDAFPELSAAGGDQLNTVGKEHDAFHDKSGKAILNIERMLLGMWVNSMDPAYGVVGNNIASDSAGLNAAYNAVEFAGGGVLWLTKPPVQYRITTNLNWTSTRVMVLGPGSGVAHIQTVGTAKILVNPTPFVVSHGPRFSGFSVIGTSTAGAIGIHCVDTIGSAWNDVAVRDFTGTGAVGVHLHNQSWWTERNQFGFTIANNTIGILVTCASAGVYSFEYNFWRPLKINAFAGQVAMVSRNNCFIRGGAIEIIGNITDTGTLMSIEGTSAWDMAANIMVEQTGGTGGQAFLQASTAFRHFRGPVDVQTLTSNTLAPLNNRQEGGGFFKDPLTGLVTTPVHMFLKSPGNRPPAVALLGAAGTSPPLPIIDPTSDGTAGRLTFGTGTGTIAGQLFQVAFADTAPHLPKHISVTPEGTVAGIRMSADLGLPAVFNITTSGFWVSVPIAPAPSQPATTYGYSWFVIL